MNIINSCHAFWRVSVNRHYGLVANTGRKRNLKYARVLLHAQEPESSKKTEGEAKTQDYADTFIYPKCHAPMVIIELLIGINYPRAPPEKIINPVEKWRGKK